MLLEVDAEQWERFVSVNEASSLFTNMLFLQTTASNFNVNLSFYIWNSDEGTALLGFPVFWVGKTIKAPTNLHSFYIVEGLGSRTQKTNAFFQCMKAMQAKFSSINLKLVIDFPYITVFSELGFNISDRYTYEKKLNDLQYSRNISRIIKKGIANHYVISKSANFQTSFATIWQSNSAYLIGSNKTKFSAFFFSLYKSGLCQIFDVHQRGVYVASLLTLKDLEQKKVFTYLISIPDKKRYPEAQTMLYNYCMSYYKNKGYLLCDLCGANLPSVAQYKSKFNGELKMYKVVAHYSSYRAKITYYIKKRLLKVVRTLIGNKKYA